MIPPPTSCVRPRKRNANGLCWVRIIPSLAPILGAAWSGASPIVPESIPVNVAVVTPGPQLPLDRVFVVVDHSPDGRAALDLGIRLVKRTRRSLHVILVPRTEIKPDLPLLEMVRSVGRAEGLRLHTDVLAERNAAQLARQAPGPLLIIGTNLLDEFILPQSGLGGHSTIVVQGVGGERQAFAAEHDRGAAGSTRTG